MAKMRRMFAMTGFAGVGTLAATLLPASLAFTAPTSARMLSSWGGASSQAGWIMLSDGGRRVENRLLRKGCPKFTPNTQSLGRILPQFYSLRRLAVSKATIAAAEFSWDEEREDHNEMVADAMEEGAKDFERIVSTVEIALDVPQKWWQEIVSKRLDRIAETCMLTPNKKVLDIGTGTGTMIPYLTTNGRALKKDVVGVDLSATMLEIASKRHPDVTFVKGDILDLELKDLQSQDSEDETAGSDAVQKSPPPFDAVVMNSVYSILFDPEATLRRASELLVRGGRLVISHPLGADFVEKLKSQDPVFISHSLPRTRESLQKLIAFAPLAISQEIIDEEELYIAVLERTPVRALEKVLCLRGPVSTGYGRGGKKLGVPTANLPESLFADALAAVPAGVYLGWAAVEDGPAVRAVVNVGYSPTFVGEENRQKIVEANLRADMGGDFYNREMRLLLCGFLRPERRFDSFPALVAAIRQDIEDAEAALAAPPFAGLARHPFLGPAGRDSAPAAAVAWAQAAQAAALAGGQGGPAGPA